MRADTPPRALFLSSSSSGRPSLRRRRGCSPSSAPRSSARCDRSMARRLDGPVRAVRAIGDNFRCCASRYAALPKTRRPQRGWVVRHIGSYRNYHRRSGSTTFDQFDWWEASREGRAGLFQGSLSSTRWSSSSGRQAAAPPMLRRRGGARRSIDAMGRSVSAACAMSAGRCSAFALRGRYVGLCGLVRATVPTLYCMRERACRARLTARASAGCVSR